MKKILFFVTAIIFLYIPFFCSASEEVDEARTVRIGLIEPKGSADSQIKKLLQRYTQVYMIEVSKHTNWKYTYENGTLAELREKLLSNELDFIGPFIKCDAEPGMLCASGGTFSALLGLYCRTDNKKFSASDADSVKGARIGFADDDSHKKFLDYYIRENHWEVTPIKFNSSEELMKNFRAGKIDIIVDDGTHVTDNERILGYFGQSPEFFVTTEEKSELLNTLNDALLAIEIKIPFFANQLADEYLYPVLQNTSTYTEEEKTFIAKAPELTVAFLPPHLPLYDLSNKNSPTGICIDQLNLLAEESGLKFKFVQAASQDEIGSMLWSGKADIAYVVFASGAHSNSVMFSNVIYLETFAPVMPQEMKEIPDGGKVALPICFPGMQSYWKEHFPTWEVIFYETVEECLDAVDNGETDITYLPILFLRLESNMISHPNLQIDELNSVRLPVCLAISPHQPQILQRILNTAILHQSNERLASLALKNAEPEINLRYLWARYPFQSTAVLVSILGGIGIALVIFLRKRFRLRQERILRDKDHMLKTALDVVADMKESRDKYKLESELDKLTQLYNKAATEKLCRERLENFSDETLAALYIIDLDKFKQANDTHGHQYGDEILKNFASALKKVFRSNDIVGRFGGDEFVVMISDLPNEEIILRKAQDIHRVAQNIKVGEKIADITASIGFAIAPKHGTLYENLFKAADEALYLVKKNGRNGYRSI